jgi:alanine racemase
MSERERRAWVEVNLAAISDNARAIARITGTRLLPIVKANAYGTGAVAVSEALEALDPWGYGVATLDEAIELRAGGIERPILVFLPAQPDVFETYFAHRLTPVLTDRTAIRRWSADAGRNAAERRGFHLEVDTGMGRTGVAWEEVEQLRDALDVREFEGCFTHFHSAELDDGSVEAQLERFRAALDRLPRRPPLVHVANSAAALRGRDLAFDAIRPGVFLYGGSAGPGLPVGKPVVSLRARIVSLRPVRRGQSVSYHASWVASHDTVVATLAIGYGDGLRRDIAKDGRAAVLIRGTRCPVIGLVNMDFTMVETGGGQGQDEDAAIRVGDVATLIGEDGGSRITLEEFASWGGDLQRESLTRLGPRLPRVY